MQECLFTPKPCLKNLPKPNTCIIYRLYTCADPENFVRGVPTLTTFFFCLVDEGWEKYHSKRAINGPPAKRIECWLGSLMIFQVIWTRIAKKPYIFVIFQGGGGGGPDPCPALGIRTWYMYVSLQARKNVTRTRNNTAR